MAPVTGPQAVRYTRAFGITGNHLLTLSGKLTVKWGRKTEDLPIALSNGWEDCHVAEEVFLRGRDPLLGVVPAIRCLG